MADRKDGGQPKASAAGKGAKAKSSSAASNKPPAKKAAPARSTARTKQPDLKKDLRDFASGRPQGWGHDDWLNFLESLNSRGHDVGDREAIGVALERERLDLALSGIKGIGPQKRKSLSEYYSTLWALRHADPDEIARVGSLTRSAAEQLKEELR